MFFLLGICCIGCCNSTEEHTATWTKLMLSVIFTCEENGLKPGGNQLHLLATVGNDGMIIDHAALFTVGCGGDAAYFGSCRYTINSDVTVALSDTTATAEVDAQGEPVAATLKTAAHHYHMWIDDRGYIHRK